MSIELKKQTIKTGNEEKQAYRAPEVAHYLSIAKSTVWLYAKQGKLTPIKLSSRVTVFKKEELDALLNGVA